MYTKEILKKRPQTTNYGVIPWTGGYAGPRQQMMQQHQHLQRVRPHADGERYMDKLPFAEYLKDVEKVLKAGDLVTIRAAPYRPEQLPVPLMKIKYIQEINYMAPVDRDSNEPRCLVLERHDGTIITAPFYPRQLRKLNDEELKLVNSLDTKAEGFKEALDASLRAATEGDPVILDSEDSCPGC